MPGGSPSEDCDEPLPRGAKAPLEGCEEITQDQTEEERAYDQDYYGQHHPLDTLPPGPGRRALVGGRRVGSAWRSAVRGHHPDDAGLRPRDRGLGPPRLPGGPALGAHTGPLDNWRSASVAVRGQTPFRLDNRDQDLIKLAAGNRDLTPSFSRERREDLEDPDTTDVDDHAPAGELGSRHGVTDLVWGRAQGLNRRMTLRRSPCGKGWMWDDHGWKERQGRHRRAGGC